jgi:hypothetical protein
MEPKIEKPGGTAAGGKRHHNIYHKKAAAITHPKFEGRCAELKGFVFDCTGGKQAGQYNLSMNEIAEYFGRTCTYGGDMQWTIENEQKLKIEAPKDLPDEIKSATAKRIWEKRVDEFIKR